VLHSSGPLPVISVIGGAMAMLSLLYALFFIAVAVPAALHSGVSPYAFAVPMALGPPAAIAAIVCGHLARRQSAKTRLPASWGGAVIAGVILGYAFWAILILIGIVSVITFSTIK
jgi:hypothetical protein